MSVLIRHRQLEENDFVFVADDAPLPEQGRIIVTLARWQKEAEALRRTSLIVGVRLPNTVDVGAVGAELADRPLINVEFPNFADGRAYSQARVLRERFQYAGEIRASGAAVVRDQIHSMHRCGIDSFELRADQDPQACLKAFEDFHEAYQPACESRPTVFALRSSASG